MTALLALLLTFANASFLQMRGEPKVELVDAGDHMVLKGEYAIHNEGDETAWQVFPVLGIDQYRWIGTGKNINPGQGFVWVLNERISTNDLCQEPKPGCQVELPSKGNFAVKVEKHYQDQNSYQFVVPDVFFVPVKANLFSSLNMNMEIVAQGGELFEARYNLENPNSYPVKAAVTPLLPLEVRPLSTPVPVEIPANGQVSGIFQFENQKGLPGSHYLAILTAEWAHEGHRNSQYVSGGFQIPKSSPAKKLSVHAMLWIWFGLGMFLGLMAMWIFWIRPLKKLS